MCLDVLVSNYGRKENGGVTDAQFDTIVAELPALITEADLHVSQVRENFNPDEFLDLGLCCLLV